MTEVKPPPNQHNLIDQRGNITPQWGLFFEKIFKGSTGTEFTPEFVSLTENGGDATITGIYYQITKALAFFRVSIVPVTSTSSSAGNTYFTFPLNVQGNSVCFAISGTTGGSIGSAIASTNRIYTPSWSNDPAEITVVGILEAN
jgi:hypothetical protein